MPKITPYLWFNDNAEEAMEFYAGVFKDSAIGEIQRLPEGTPGPAGKVITGSFRLGNQELMVLNGGPVDFHFNESISFLVDVDTQEEVDYFWNALISPGEVGQCGWLKDKYGLSWQIVPKALDELMSDPDPKKAQATMQAMLKMKKLDIAALQAAHDNA